MLPALDTNPDEPLEPRLPPAAEAPPLGWPAKALLPARPESPALNAPPALLRSAPPLPLELIGAPPAMLPGRYRSSELREPQPATRPEKTLKSRAPQTISRF